MHSRQWEIAPLPKNKHVVTCHFLCHSFAQIFFAPLPQPKYGHQYNVVSGWSIGSQATSRCPQSRTYGNLEGHQNQKKPITREKKILKYIKIQNNSNTDWICAKRNPFRSLYTCGYLAPQQNRFFFSFFFFSSLDLYFIDAAKEILCLMILL